MHRLPFLAVLGLVVLAFAAPARATVGPSVTVQWIGDRPQPARAGAEFVGRFELVSGLAGRIENLRVHGEGWSVRQFDGPATLVLPPHSHRQFTFRAVPTDPSAPIEVSGTVNGMPFRKVFRFDEERLARYAKPREARFARAPIVGGRSKLESNETNSSPIRFHGRVIYTRQDALTIGVDNIVVRVMDDDPAPLFEDEQIALVLTDAAGYFDVTVPWNDDDGGIGDNPDVYLLIEAANLVCQVRNDDLGDMYDWTTQSWEFHDVTGTDVDFGDVIPLTDVPSLHVWNSIIKGNRHIREQGGMTPSHVFVNWPSTDTLTYYNGEVFISPSETWNEGSHIHEYGHHVQSEFNTFTPVSYMNGFCDSGPRPSHCLSCPESDVIAWGEGWADWYASRMMRVWQGAYGFAPLSVDDDRWDLESQRPCQQDDEHHDGSNVEGNVGVMLRDIEDALHDPLEFPEFCRADLLSFGDIPIFTIFRDDHPKTVQQFITAFRARYPAYDRDLWVLLHNLYATYNFPEPPLVVSLLPSCRIAMDGDPVTFSVAINGGLAKYQWRRNGLPLSDFANFSGTHTASMTIAPVGPYSSPGTYDCVVTPCSLPAVTTNTTTLRVESPPSASTFVSWGENGAAQVGNGTTSTGASYYLHPGLTDVVAADGGRTFSMILRGNGQVLTWGVEQWGELGNGGIDNSQVNAPAPIAVTDAVRIAAGKSHALALLKDGTMTSWGFNFYGQLFTGDQNGRGIPGPTQFIGCVKEIAASEFCSYALLADGTVWSVGYNGYGALGIGTFTGVYSAAQQVVGLTNVIDIDAAGLWAMALRADSTVWTWGGNTWGQLGLGHYNSVATPTQVPGLVSIKQIAAGADNLYALRSDGRLWVAGYGPALGIGWDGGSSNVAQLNPLTNIRYIDGGSGDFAMAVMSNGRLKGWGLNAGSYPGSMGVLGSEGPYVIGSPVDIQNVFAVTGVGAGWGTAHAFGQLGVTDVPPPDEAEGAPTVLALAALPNPARGVSAIHFDLPRGGDVTLGVFDVAGRLVRTLADETFEPGRHVRAWDGTTNAGVRASAGVYFLRLAAPGGALTKTLVRVE